MDLQNTDCILIMGSNFAEAHPVGYRFVMRARERGAEVIHVDPRYTRTSATATSYAQIRAGSDVAFLGGLVRHVLNSERWNADPFFREYVAHYTNASTILKPEFIDAADLGGLFSGWNEAEQRYDRESWLPVGSTDPGARAGGADEEPADVQTSQSFGARAGDESTETVRRDPTLEHPLCVLQVLKRHFDSYTPEMVERVTGVPARQMVAIGDALLRNSGRERTSVIAYAVGWTQHTNGPQLISTAAILQLLLGNIGRPGGGIQALRGHATIQGSTDIPTLYDLLPGYLRMRNHTEAHDTRAGYVESEASRGGLWAHAEAYLASLLRAWFGRAAGPDNEGGFQLLPRITGDHSHLPMFVKMHNGEVDGLFLMGQNPAVGGQNARFQRAALGRLKWLVVRDLFPIESATFWKEAPEVMSGEVVPESIDTEVFLLPAASVLEKDGSFTNTQRLIQWHHRAVEAPGDCRSDAWFMDQLWKRVRAHYASSSERRDEPIRALTWDYPASGAHDEPEVEYVLREINGFAFDDAVERDWDARVAAAHRADRDALLRQRWTARAQLATSRSLRDDGDTACGCWIYCGVFGDGNRAASRDPGDGWVAPGWGFAWPANVRMLYNRCSADPAGRPWSERKRYVWWDADEKRWVGADQPDFAPDKEPRSRGRAGAVGLDAHDGDAPFVMKDEGRAWLFFPQGLKDAPLPTHYEPWETPVPNALYPLQPRNPMTGTFDVAGNPYHGIANPRYPHVLTTYRLTEHHTGGGMTRWNAWLSELQPEAFVEIDERLAAELGVESGGWVTVITARGEADARAMVTRRLRPLWIGGRRVHQVGFPWHFGYSGVATGSVANDLVALVTEPNVSIHEGKALTCDVRAGRARTGRAPGSAGTGRTE